MSWGKKEIEAALDEAARNSPLIAMLDAKVAALESENRALREALRDVTRDTEACSHEPSPECCRWCFARAALAHPTGDSEP